MNKSQAIEHFGSVTALAKALGVTYEAVRQWGEVPELRQYQLEHLTGGALKADQLPTMSPTLRASVSGRQSSSSAGILSSTSQASQ